MTKNTACDTSNNPSGQYTSDSRNEQTKSERFKASWVGCRRRMLMSSYCL